MSFRFVVVLLVTLVFATSENAFAQVKAGLNELSFAASVFGTKSEGSDTTTAATLTGSYGRFLGDHFEVGPLLTIAKAEGIDAFGTISGYGAYHVNTASAVVPFAGAQIGRGFGLASAFSDNPWVYGFFGGVKAFVGESGAITIQPFWTRHTTHDTVFDTNFHTDSFGVSAGVSIFWN